MCLYLYIIIYIHIYIYTSTHIYIYTHIAGALTMLIRHASGVERWSSHSDELPQDPRRRRIKDWGLVKSMVSQPQPMD
jgi:hypothetical protein